jgi:hypothetical protein
MNKQPSLRDTLIEACGAQLMILAMAAAWSFLTTSPAQAEPVEILPAAIQVATASEDLHALPEPAEGGRPPLSTPSSRRNFTTCFQIDMEFIDRFERTRRKFFLNP